MERRKGLWLHGDVVGGGDGWMDGVVDSSGSSSSSNSK